MKNLHALVLFVSGCFVIGCSAFTPPTPTPTPAPTETPTPLPTVTSAPTRLKPTATPENQIPSAIAFALNKTQNASTMNFEFESVVTITQNGQTQKIPGLTINGYDSTLNRQVTISGTTSDTREFITYDVIVIGQDVYVKGLASNGLDTAQWYRLPEPMQSGVRRLPTARGLIASFDPADVGKARFQQAGTENVDDETCTVWDAQNTDFAQTLVGVTPDSELGKQLGTVDSAEFKLWTCADGYIHLMTGSVQGHSAQNAADKTGVTLRFRMTDFDQSQTIQPPSDAKSLPTPSQAGATPTARSAAPTPTETKSATTPP